MTKRFLSLLLALLMIFPPVLTACSSSQSETEEETEDQQDDVLRKYIAVTLYGIMDDSTTEDGLAAVEEKISNYCVARYKTSVDLRLFRESEYENALKVQYDGFAVKDEEARVAQEQAAESSRQEKELLRGMTKEEKQAYSQQKRIAEKEAKEAAKRAKEEEAKLVEEGKDQAVGAEEIQLDILYLPTKEAYYEAVANGQLLELDSYLASADKNKLIANYVHPDFLTGAKVDGKIYGIPVNAGVETKETYLVVNKALSEKYGVDWSQVHSLLDLEDVFARVKAAEGVTPVVGDFGPEDVVFFAPDGMSAGHAAAFNTSLLPGDPFTSDSFYQKSEVKKEKDADGKEVEVEEVVDVASPVVNTFTTAGADVNTNFYRFAQWKNRWRQAGYIADSGNNFFLSVQELSEEERQAQEDAGYLTVLYKGAPFTTDEALKHGVYAVSSRCTAPERAMEVLQLFYTDDTLHDYFAFGIEETNYVVNPDGTVHIIDPTYKMDPFKSFNLFLGHLPEELGASYTKTSKAKNLNANPDPFLGLGNVDWDSEELAEWKAAFADWERVAGDRFRQLYHGAGNALQLCESLTADLNNPALVSKTLQEFLESKFVAETLKPNAAALAAQDGTAKEAGTTYKTDGGTASETETETKG